MMSEMKKLLYNTHENHYGDDSLEWITDFSPDSSINTLIRKSTRSDLINFAMFNEGNVYNKLINKVLLILFIILTDI